MTERTVPFAIATAAGVAAAINLFWQGEALTAALGIVAGILTDHHRGRHRHGRGRAERGQLALGRGRDLRLHAVRDAVHVPLRRPGACSATGRSSPKARTGPARFACTSASSPSPRSATATTRRPSNLGHALAVLEALIGQLYLVTVVAVVVTRLGRPGRKMLIREEEHEARPTRSRVGSDDRARRGAWRCSRCRCSRRSSCSRYSEGSGRRGRSSSASSSSCSGSEPPPSSFSSVPRSRARASRRPSSPWRRASPCVGVGAWLLARSRRGASVKEPAWLARLDRMEPWPAFLLGLVLPTLPDRGRRRGAHRRDAPGHDRGRRGHARLPRRGHEHGLHADRARPGRARAIGAGARAATRLARPRLARSEPCFSSSWAPSSSARPLSP